MLAVRWPAIFTDPAWAFELKWDGVRTLLFAEPSGVTLRSRTGNDTTRTYPELTAFDPGRPVILDGEVVALDDGGRPSFERLQQRMNVSAPALVARKSAAVPITFVVFDMLYDREPIIERPWVERRRRLGELELPQPFVPSGSVDGDPEPMWHFVEQRGIEGIVAKRHDGTYRPGMRSPEWRKISHFRTVRAVVAGYTAGDRGRTGSFGSLVLGLYDGAALRWVGLVGSGFGDEQLRVIRQALDQMVTAESPFEDRVESPRPVTWVHPQLVAVVQYKEWTEAGRLRAPSFKGFTTDPPETVTWQAEGPGAPG